MYSRTTLLRIAAGLVAATLTSAATAAVRTPAILSDNMVVQCGQPVPIWGWAEKGEVVTVSFAGQTAKAKADDKGCWKVILARLEAGGPHEMTITAPSGNRTIKNVLIGEVWVSGGQSNMAMVVHAVMNSDKEAAAATHPGLRLFSVKETRADKPAADVEGRWFVCNPHDTTWYSAIPYFFGRMLHQDLKVPVGMISTAVGGTPVQSWGDRNTLDRLKIGGGAELYNGMVAPLMPLAMRGVIWYQGEGNVGETDLFRTVFPEQIRGWRANWGQGEFPFLFVELAPCRYPPPQVGLLPGIWDTQLFALKTVPNTGMAVTTDLVDDIKSVHPINKQDVAKRLGLWALAKVYDRKVGYSGPIYQSMEVEGDKIRIKFDQAEGMKSCDSKPISDFTIAGADQKFYPADAQVDGQTIVVSSKDVAKPEAVRFGWTEDANPNLRNKDGLPASPFRTDLWKLK